MNMVSGMLELLLVGQADRLQSMGNRFRGRSAEFNSDDLVTGLILVAAVALAVFILARLRARQEKRGTYNNPWALFRELCKAHQLDRASCRLLRELARSQRLDQPARLFLEPERYEPSQLSPQLAKQVEALRELRDRLIGSDEPRSEADAEAAIETNAATQNVAANATSSGRPVVGERV